MKKKRIPTELFDCKFVKEERRKVYLEMAELYGNVTEKDFISFSGVKRIPVKNTVDFLCGCCVTLYRYYLFQEYSSTKELIKHNFFELEIISPGKKIISDIYGHWFDLKTIEGYHERATALLFLYYSMEQ